MCGRPSRVRRRARRAVAREPPLQGKPASRPRAPFRGRRRAQRPYGWLPRVRGWRSGAVRARGRRLSRAARCLGLRGAAGSRRAGCLAGGGQGARGCGAPGAAGCPRSAVWEELAPAWEDPRPAHAREGPRRPFFRGLGGVSPGSGGVSLGLGGIRGHRDPATWGNAAGDPRRRATRGGGSSQTADSGPSAGVPCARPRTPSRPPLTVCYALRLAVASTRTPLPSGGAPATPFASRSRGRVSRWLRFPCGDGVFPRPRLAPGRAARGRRRGGSHGRRGVCGGRKPAKGVVFAAF